jgi:hypothetical protein
VKKSGGNADELMAEVAKLKEQMANDELAELKSQMNCRRYWILIPMSPPMMLPLARMKKITSLSRLYGAAEIQFPRPKIT